MIDWSALFNAVNLLAMIAWVALILLPRWPALLSGLLQASSREAGLPVALLGDLLLREGISLVRAGGNADRT